MLTEAQKEKRGKYYHTKVTFLEGLSISLTGTQQTDQDLHFSVSLFYDIIINGSHNSRQGTYFFSTKK